MTETRRIIGVFDELLSTKKDVAFPSVRVWIDAPPGRDTSGLKHSFPQRGTVFLHISACDGQHPARNQVGLFTCIPSPGERAEWKVSRTSRHLGNVVVCPTWERNAQHLAFWEWLRTYSNGGVSSILLGDGSVFVRRGKNELVGPFQFAPAGGLVPRKQTQVFQGIETIEVDVAGRTCEFIDTEALTRGRTLICDPREAIHRRLKLVQDVGHFDWLSRGKVEDLSNVLAGLTVSDGSEWVMENLRGTLEAVSASIGVDKELSEVVLKVKKVSDAIEAAWKKGHGEEISKAQGEIEELGNKAEGIRKTIEDLSQDVARLTAEKDLLQDEAQDLNRKNEATKIEARKVFETELKRLAASPESLALFASWSGATRSMSESKAELRVRTQRWDFERPVAASLWDALSNNLKISGLSPPSANEVATVCSVTLHAGQPISFRSIFSDLLADAVISSLGEPTALWADVPAGLLDPIDWESLRAEEQVALPVVLQGINRSDIALVLGSMRAAVFRQAIGQQKPISVLCVTLEPSKDMQVQPDFELGPVLDDRVLKFGSTKSKGAVSAFAAYRSSLTELPAVSEEDFLEIVGESGTHLPMFATSAQKVVHRKAIAGLKMCTNNSEEIRRLFFKYWVLPRLSPRDIVRVLDGHKEKWKQDTVLNELAQKLTSGE